MLRTRKNTTIQSVCQHSWQLEAQGVPFTSEDVITWNSVKAPLQSACHHLTGRKYKSIGAMQRSSSNFKFNGSSVFLDSTQIEYGHADLVSVAFEALPAGQPASSRLDAYNYCLELGLDRPAMDMPLFIYEFKDCASMIGQISTRCAALTASISQFLAGGSAILASLFAREGYGGPGFSMRSGRRGHVTEIEVLRRYGHIKCDEFARTLMHGMTLKQLSNDWLLVQLGIAPTLADFAGMKVVAKKLSAGYTNLRREVKSGTKVRAPYRVSSAPTIPSPTSWGSENYLRRDWTTGYVTPLPKRYAWTVCSGVVSGRLAETLKVTEYERLKHLTRFDQGPLGFAWEATRFSWLADYLIGIGKALASAERYNVALSRGVQFAGGIWDSFKRIDINGYYPGAAEISWYLDSKYPPADPLARYRLRTNYGIVPAAELYRVTEFTREEINATWAMTQWAQSIKGPRLTPTRLGTVASLVYQSWGPGKPAAVLRSGVRS